MTDDAIARHLGEFYGRVARANRVWLIANGFAKVCPVCGETVHLGEGDEIPPHGTPENGPCLVPSIA